MDQREIHRVKKRKGNRNRTRKCETEREREMRVDDGRVKTKRVKDIKDTQSVLKYMFYGKY